MCIRDRVYAATVALTELLDALLDMARLETRSTAVTSEDFVISAVLLRIETMFAGAACEKGLKLIMPASHTRIRVRTDAILLERMLINLVSNALRCTVSGGVLIGCRRRDNRLLIEVHDTGCGIPADQQQAIFTDYHRIGPADATGLGIGLAIVRRLAEETGCTVTLNSRPGKGTCFRLSVPLAVTQLVSAPKDPIVQNYPSAFAVRTILVIDDDPLILESMAGLLSVWGCRVITATSGSAAVQALAQANDVPAVIISDLRLGNGETGHAAIRRVRDEIGQDVPAVIMTGDTVAQEQGRPDCPVLGKPVSPMRLRAVITALISCN